MPQACSQRPAGLEGKRVWRLQLLQQDRLALTLSTSAAGSRELMPLMLKVAIFTTMAPVV